MKVELRVPVFTEDHGELSIYSLNARVNQKLRQEEPVFVIESDDGLMEMRSPCHGVVTQYFVEEDEIVEPGELVATMLMTGQLDNSEERELKVPPISELGDITIAALHVKAGEPFRKDAPLVDLETDKAVLEINAPSDGVITEFQVHQGDFVESDQVIARIKTTGEQSESIAKQQPIRSSSSQSHKPQTSYQTRKPAAVMGIDKSLLKIVGALALAAVIGYLIFAN
ncbi:biotin/lipoyl-binding protein [Shewanella submarina]|uniref:Biotin/lipoyl-containing protein n=1 Tax=Shewanella submarina TaxID=2016376 RepID=A0ABV7GAG8_9GAMM|nr:biotin/lipoyl-containing protein [Shewanella submarina]MCL1038510.1 biotin/lipoyl-binding protein [Shewanella submarina]